MNKTLPPNSIDVNLLKEIILGDEQKKVNQLQDLVIDHQSRIGTDTHLKKSVAKIITGALLEAGVDNYKELSSAISPLVINVIRQEIRNSKSEIAQALYPEMGKLMSSYVTSNLYEFITGTDRKIERVISPKYLWLTLKSYVTGQTFEQLLLEDARVTQVRDIMLINKETGLLIEHRHTTHQNKISNYDTSMISSMLTAINGFSQEVFSNDYTELKALDFGNFCIYLQSSPLFIVAISCTGHASGRLKSKFNQLLLSFLTEISSKYPLPDQHQYPHQSYRVLPSLAERLTKALVHEIKQLRTRRTPVFSIIFFGMLFLSLSGWAATRYIEKQSRILTQTDMEKIIARQYAFQGFPVRVKINPKKKIVFLSGLSPSPEQTEALIREIAKKYPEMKILPHLISVFSEKQFQQKLVTSAISDENDENSATNSGLNENKKRKKLQVNTGNVQSDKTEKNNRKTHKHALSGKEENNTNISTPDVSLPQIKNWPNFNLDEAIDFNDPTIKKELEKARKFVVPGHLKKKSIFPGVNGKGNRNSNGNSSSPGNAGNTGNTGNSNGQGAGASNSNKANAPGQMKKK